MQCPKKAAQQ
jgi:hypothetical protein